MGSFERFVIVACFIWCMWTLRTKFKEFEKKAGDSKD